VWAFKKVDSYPLLLTATLLKRSSAFCVFFVDPNSNLVVRMYYGVLWIPSNRKSPKEWMDDKDKPYLAMADPADASPAAAGTKKP